MARPREASRLGGLVSIIPNSITATGGSATIDSAGNITFTSASAISLNNCFTSSFRNYKIILEISGSSAITSTYLKLRNSGTDLSTGYYWAFAGTGEAGGAVTWYGSNQSSGWNMQNWRNSVVGTYCTSNLDMFNPYEQTQKNFTLVGSLLGNDGTFYGLSGGGHTTSTSSYDGFTYSIASGTFTGKVKVYGYRN
jgi:hypothetical protein